MGTALLILAALAGLLLVLLAVPIDVAFRVRGIESLQGQFNIRWLFGLLRFRLQLPSPARPKPQARRPDRPPASTARAARKTRRRRAALAVLREAGFRDRCYCLVKDFLRAAHLRLDLRIRLGLGDPADTGRLWALIGPLNAAAPSLHDVVIRIEPEFIDAVFEFDAQGQCRLVPLQLLALAGIFAVSPPSLRAWRSMSLANA